MEHLPVLTEGLHLAAVDAKVYVADPADLAVISRVGVYHLDEVGVTGIQTIHQTRSDKRTGGIQTNYSVYPEEQIIGHDAADMSA